MYHGRTEGPPPPPPLFFSEFIVFLKVTVFRVVLCNHPKDVHVLWVWSEVELSPKLFFGPLFLNFLDPPLCILNRERYCVKEIITF